VNGGSGVEPATRPRVFTRPPAPGGRPVHVDVRDQLPGVLAGAAIALLGVWLGAQLGRRR